MGTYPATGPFNAGTAPGVSASFLNNVESQLGIALTTDGAYTATTPSPLVFSSIGGSDLTGWSAKVSGDTQQRIGQYIRHSDNYGGLLGGAGSSITAHLYAQAGGWRITESLTIDTNLTVSTNATVSGTLGITGLTTATGGINVNNISAISGNVIFGSAITLPASTNINTDQLHTVSSTSGMTIIVGSSGFLGVKTSGNTKLMEAKANGNMVIAGAYQTTGATSTIGTGATFDAFDYGECYVHDQDYANGTVVCLGDDGKMTRCLHDNCPAALIISKNPGYMTGEDDEAPEEDHVMPLALAGRVKAIATPGGVSRGRHVVSNGDGGVRALVKGKWGYALGVAITNTDDDGRVGVLVRPMFCKGV